MNSIINQVQRKHGCFMQSLKLMTAATIVVSSGIFSHTALATCTITGPVDRIINNLNSFDIVVDGSRPMGANIGTLQTLDNNPEAYVYCTNLIGNYSGSTEYPMTASTGTQKFDSGIPGIGISIYTGIRSSNYIPFSDSTIASTSATTINSPTRKIYVALQLWKTDEIISDGQISATPILAKFTLPDHEDITIANLILGRPINVRLLRPTCSAGTPNYNVDLGQVSIVDFNASGRTPPKDFSIDLTCTGGTHTTNVHVTLTDANNPGNATTQLGLSPDSDAQGIALEVNNRFGAVTFGPDLSGTGNPGQWLDGAAGVGSYSIPLSVNYVRLGGPIKGGTANSGVTYTLNYD